MKYTVEDLIKEKKDWRKDDFIFFWKIHKDKEVNKSCLSQWYPSEFIVRGRRYNCAEQYMMAQKVLLFEDEESYKKIMASSEPKEIKTLGRKVKGFDSVKWDEEKYRIVREGNFAKFTQKKELRDYLVSTEGKILVEASPYDNIWGIGMTESNPDILDPSKWKGQNLLGFLLMDIREELIERIPEPEFFEWEEEFVDDTTGDIIMSKHQKYNEKYLPEPNILWLIKEDEEELYIWKKGFFDNLKKDCNKIVSDKVKDFFRERISIFPAVNNLDKLTYKEAQKLIDENKLSYTINIDYNKPEGKFRYWSHMPYDLLQKYGWFSKIKYDTFIEAFENSIKDFQKIMVKNDKNEYIIKIEDEYGTTVFSPHELEEEEIIALNEIDYPRLNIEWN